jgi:flagellar basal-body rod modification protein FlgD
MQLNQVSSSQGEKNMIVNPLTASQSMASTTPSNPNQAANNAESTFLQLLVTELQSQDPTSPMDATQMVGQMLSMNQLNELIAINQTLQNAFPASTGTAGSTTASSATQSITGAH